MRKLIMISVLPLLLSACAERTLRIETEPSNALVFMDNRELGRTPLEIPFVYGGVREFLILKDERDEAKGEVPMKPLIVRQDVENFWFDTFPFDIFVELSPIAFHDEHALHFVMEPSDTLATYEIDPDAYADALKGRALEMSRRSREVLEDSFPSALPSTPESTDELASPESPATPGEDGDEPAGGNSEEP